MVECRPRPPELAFSLQRPSLGLLREREVHRGHVATMHLWRARRPLAACRAVLIATPLRDPAQRERRCRLSARVGGTAAEALMRKRVSGRRGPSGTAQKGAHR